MFGIIAVAPVTAHAMAAPLIKWLLMVFFPTEAGVKWLLIFVLLAEGFLGYVRSTVLRHFHRVWNTYTIN